jgi:peptidoglycan hydrolase-like protein with peptidoglycan-binding domain
MERKLMTRLAIILVAAVFVAGCATTGSRKSKKQKAEDIAQENQDLQVKVTELQSTVDKQNQELELLRSRVDNVETSKGSGYGGDMSYSAKPTVKDIQRALKSAGYYNGGIDGKLGPKTKAAIKEFQSANGLKSDGVVGKKTWSRLRTNLN